MAGPSVEAIGDEEVEVGVEPGALDEDGAMAGRELKLEASMAVGFHRSRRTKKSESAERNTQ